MLYCGDVLPGVLSVRVDSEFSRTATVRFGSSSRNNSRHIIAEAWQYERTLLLAVRAGSALNLAAELLGTLRDIKAWDSSDESIGFENE